jgi:hypothetical protein
LAGDILYELLPEDGSPIEFEVARVALSEQLDADVSEDRLHQMVFADPRVQSVPPMHQLRRNLPAAEPGPAAEIRNGRDIEPWFERYLWQKRTAFHDPRPMTLNTVVENTARARGAGGRWTRPDVCMACVARYRYLPVPQFDLFSFELKMPGGCNMLAVHEALAHGATAHYPYLCLHLPTDAEECRNLTPMLEQAQHHGVGVMRMLDARDFSTYTRLLDARRGQPSPGKIDDFIEERFGTANRLALRRWLQG